MDGKKVSDDTYITKDDLAKILASSSLAERVTVALFAFSGLRATAIGKPDGTDGLRMGDFPEVQINYKTKTVSFTKIPTLIHVRKELSKDSHSYMTFMCEEGCQYLKTYWEDRLRRGELLNPMSPAILPETQTQTRRFPRSSIDGEDMINGVRIICIPQLRWFVR